MGGQCSGRHWLGRPRWLQGVGASFEITSVSRPPIVATEVVKDGIKRMKKDIPFLCILSNSLPLYSSLACGNFAFPFPGMGSLNYV